MKQRSIKINYIFNTVYQIIAIIVPLITAPYLARTLGADAVGIFSYTNSMTSYFMIIAVLGSTTFGQRKIAEVRDDRKKLSTEFWNIVSFRLITTTVTLIAYGIFIIFNWKYKLIYLILGINILDVFFNITWFFQGVEDFPKVVIRNLVIRIASCICIFCFVKSPDDLPLYIIFVVGFSLIANLWTWKFIPQYINKLEKVNPFQNLKEMLQLFLPTVATQIYLVLDKSMIGLITNSNYQNGCYEYSEKIARLALTVVTSIAAVILPRIANLYNNGEKEKACSYVYKGYRFVWLLAFPIMFGLMGITKVFVPVFFGPGFELSEILMPIFSTLVLFVSLSYVAGFSFLIPIGKQNVYTVVVCISAAFNLIANIILIPRYGAIGAAIASVLAEAIGITLQIIYCCKKSLLEAKLIFQACFKYLSCGLIMLAIILILVNFVPTSVIGLSILIITGGLVYFVLLLFLKDELIIANIGTAFKHFRRKR